MVYIDFRIRVLWLPIRGTGCTKQRQVSQFACCTSQPLLTFNQSPWPTEPCSHRRRRNSKEVVVEFRPSVTRAGVSYIRSRQSSLAKFESEFNTKLTDHLENKLLQSRLYFSLSCVLDTFFEQFTLIVFPWTCLDRSSPFMKISSAWQSLSNKQFCHSLVRRKSFSAR